MTSMQYICGQCQGTNFPEGMFITYCRVCKTYIHPGCWDAHAQQHHVQKDIPAEHLKPRRGRISAYGIIQWDN